jgi:DoxX-like protein
MRKSYKIGVAVWTVQILLALLFLFAGLAKLGMPSDKLAAQGPFAPDFLRFIGLAEVAGALGLVLPGLFRIHRHLTPLAATGLAIIMIGATVSTLAIGGGAAAAFPFVVGALATFVAVRSGTLSTSST